MNPDEDFTDNPFGLNLDEPIPSDKPRVDFTLRPQDYGIPDLSIEQTIQGYGRAESISQMNLARQAQSEAYLYLKTGLELLKRSKQNAILTNAPKQILDLYDEKIRKDEVEVEKAERKLREMNMDLPTGYRF